MGGCHNGEGDDRKRRRSEGEIMVERTFDVMELTVLPPADKTLDMSPIAVPKRVRSKGNCGMFNDTARLFEKSSEEDLIGPNSPFEVQNRDNWNSLDHNL